MIVTVTLNPSLDEWVSLDTLRTGQLNRARRFGRYPGGKGINVSRVLHELDVPTLALALAGGDDGKLLSQLLAARGIPRRFVTVPGATRNNYQIQTDTPPVITQVNCPGPHVPRRAMGELDATLRALRPRPSYAVLSGSLPPGVPVTIYARLLRWLRQAGVCSVLDTSGAALGEGLKARPWLIKPNRHEAEELLGRSLGAVEDVAEAAMKLTARGPELAMISLGADGAVLAEGATGRVWLATPPAVKVGSPVGAGDSLVAGFVASCAARRTLQDALRLGVACGAAAAMTPGTELCHRQDVNRLKSRVRITLLR